MADQTRRVVHIALAGNVAIALCKLAAWALSGSGSMLTEAIHSLVDSFDQVLLLFGQRRARKRRDRTHPLGYGMEAYFWSFVVALMVFGAGGLASIYEGLRRIRSPEPITQPAVSLAVLAMAALFEGWSFSAGYREYRRIVGRRKIAVWDFIVASKDPGLFATLLEDSAALVGIVIAAIGVAGASWGGLPMADGIASMAIGVLLIAVSVVLANETRSLIAGEAVARPVLAELKGALASAGYGDHVAELATLHLGPRVILVALTMREGEFARRDDVWETIRSVTAALKAVDERIAYVYVRPAA